MKTGRNDPCPCGSGKKYKRCCMHRDRPRRSAPAWRRMERLEEKLGSRLITHAERFYGSTWLPDAWLDFTLGEDTLFDEDASDADAIDEADLPAEFDTLFAAWCPYTWIPGEMGVAPPEHHPRMPIARHYLEHRGDRTDAFTRRFIEAVCTEPFSFYVVLGLRPGGTVALRDLLRRREYEVHDPVDAEELPKGGILYARVLTLDGDSILLGCAPYALPPAFALGLIDLREEWGIEADAPTEALAGRDAELRSLYFDMREELFDPALSMLPDESEESDEVSDSALPTLDPDDEGDLDPDPETAETVLRELVGEYWEQWVDKPLPELNDRTPRQAVRTGTGRERVEAFLWQFEEIYGRSVFDDEIEKLRRTLGFD